MRETLTTWHVYGTISPAPKSKPNSSEFSNLDKKIAFLLPFSDRIGPTRVRS